jgi:Rod binding domain-containing protein
MKPVGIVPFMPEQQALSSLNAARESKQAENPKSAETLKAAQQFEALLLRNVLESLQKTTKIGGDENRSNSAYRSMAVEALADGIGAAGGIGLAELIARTLEAEVAGGRK